MSYDVSNIYPLICGDVYVRVDSSMVQEIDCCLFVENSSTELIQAYYHWTLLNTWGWIILFKKI